MREQVCKYMCPYARFQSAMFDRDTMIITYDQARGEPRGSRSRKADPAAIGLGSCIDCGLCVEVCPTGIDIRNGLQYECIGCAACVDTCDQIMDRMGYPRGLVRYTTQNALARGWRGRQLLRRALRPRVLVYGTILLAVSLALFGHLALRTPLKVDVMRDRGSLGREVEGGMIENVYQLQLINTTESPRRLRIRVGGIASAMVASEPEVEVPPVQPRLVPVRVRVPAGAAAPGSSRIDFLVDALDDPAVAVRETSTFYMPR
jgi:cytochrome c oxidase accessory protein FixG